MIKQNQNLMINTILEARSSDKYELFLTSFSN